MTSPKRPRRSQASRKETGRSCPHCRFPIKERDQLMTCGVCSSPHHLECWEDVGGCAVEGCAGGVRAAESSRAVPSRAGSTAPPKAGPSSKKQPIEAKQSRRRASGPPVPPRRESGPAAHPPPAEPGEPVNRTPWWIAAGVVVFCAIVGILIVSNTFGDGNRHDNANCEKGTGKDGTPCYENGVIPNVPNDEMTIQARQFMDEWFGHVRGWDVGTLWGMLSARKRAELKKRGDDKNSFWQMYKGMAKHLDTSNVRVSLQQPSYPEEGVLSILLGEMAYRDPHDRCGTRGGITWIKWDPAGERWRFEPGVELTSQRSKDWSYQSDRLFRPYCR